MESEASSPSTFLGFYVLPISILSILLGGVIVLIFFFSDYFRKRRSELQSISKPEEISNQKQKKSNQSHSKKSHPRSQSHASEKDQIKRHHPLDLNTLKGHGDSVTALCFSPDGRNLATACGDGVVRVFKLDDASSKSFKFLRINLPAGSHPTAVVFSQGASSVVVAAQHLTGSSLYMYAEEDSKPANETTQQTKPAPTIKWEHHKVHEKRAIITLVGTSASYGTADGSTIIASCSEDYVPGALHSTMVVMSYAFGDHQPVYIRSTDINLWHGKSGKILGHVDTNQLKNTMATISPNGRFIAAAAFTADVKVWEIVYSKDGSVKEVTRVMQLKGHKSAVTWLCFAPNSEQIITASKDGSIRIWNINVRYHMDEDPKALKVIPIPLHDSKGTVLHYDHLSLSPDGKILAATHGSILQWLCAETGKVLDTADKAHEDDITGLSWSPKSIPVGNDVAMILATSGPDKKVKLWMTPALQLSKSCESSCSSTGKDDK